MTDQLSTPDPKPFGAKWNWRTVGMLALFAVIVAASVIAADLFTTRDRSVPPDAPTTTRSSRFSVSSGFAGR